MENLAGPRLLQAFFDHAPDEALSNLDNPTKAALRLSCKNAKAFVDGTVTTAAGGINTLQNIRSCDWQLSKLYIGDGYQPNPNARLSSNDFTSLLHAVCSKFPTLQVLEIHIRPPVYRLPANIGQLSKLSVLKVTRAHFSALPPSFGQLSSLERLELSESYGPDASSRHLTIEGLAPLKQLTQLRYLELYAHIVSQPFFPGWFGSCNFPVLEDLILGGGLLNLPSSIGSFRSLTALVIEESPPSEVPESIGSLNLLKNLCIEADVSLPTSFSKLTALEQLDVSTDMQSFALVEHFHKLTELKFAHRNNEEIVPYPEFLWTFTSLKILELSGSDVPSLPDALGNLKNLECLHLGDHVNEELPEIIINLTALTSLTILNCDRLIKFPESIRNLKVLRRLGIHRCSELRTLPESIGDLQRLETLNLSLAEKFERLPSSIGNLHALKSLLIASNGKVFLPETFADLVLDKPIEECSLERVIFSRNLITSSPRVTLALNLLLERGVLKYLH
jgi:Leucine-rich repeat (LRR) protein